MPKSLLRIPDAASRNPFTGHGKETPDDVHKSYHVTQEVQKDAGAAVHAGDMEAFSVANVSGSTAMLVLSGVTCDAGKTCLTSQLLLSASVFIYFKGYSDTEQFLTYPSAKLVETVDIAITLMESMLAEVTHLSSVEQHITAAIKNSIDLEWIKCIGCSIHHQLIAETTVHSRALVSNLWYPVFY
jgi:hypothetical protein